MFSYEIIIYTNSDELENLIHIFFSYLYQQFIILNKYNIIRNKTLYCVVVNTHIKNLSDIINNSFFVRIVKENVKLDFRIKYLGINLDSKGICNCKKSKYYILYSDEINGPIICGNCCKNVILNELNNLSEYIDYSDIINWKDAYDGMYTFWLSSVYDELSNYQINDISSALSKYGLEICNKYSQVLKNDVYYALNEEDIKFNCPKCGKKLLQAKLHKPFKHICKNCKLIFIE